MTEEQQEVRQLAREWFDLATGSAPLPDNVFFRFVALWVGFNGWSASKFPEAGTDKAQINAFGNWKEARIAHRDALAAREYREAVAVFEERGVFNYQTREVERLQDRSDVTDVIALAYRVRCNLFHARKVTANLRDRRLVRAAHVVVEELLHRVGSWHDARSSTVEQAAVADRGSS